MKVRTDTTELTVEAVVNGFARQSIIPDPEYQRGKEWTQKQQQVLVDSIYRGYPLPRFYFSLQEATDPLGNRTTGLQIIDGYQRILALSGYLNDHWPLLEPQAERHVFPRAVAHAPCPWAGRLFSDLPTELQDVLRGSRLPVVLIERFESADEVRDLFIRLQSGTALTRQQVRDAWPGNVGPYVESIAGKLRRLPRFDFLGRLDRRGSRRDDEDLDDPFHDARVTGAQLLRLFLERQKGQIPAVDARALDDLYHSQTDFDPRGEVARAFERLLRYCQQIIGDRAPLTSGGSKAKVAKLRLFGLSLALMELEAAPDVRVDQEIPNLAEAFWNAAWWNQEDGPRQGRATSRGAISAYYHWFAERVVPAAKIKHLDPRRTFSEEQKAAIRGSSDGTCGLCGGPLLGSAVDYDHVVPWIRGGRTEAGNGRVTHSACNRARRDAGE